MILRVVFGFNPILYLIILVSLKLLFVISLPFYFKLFSSSGRTLPFHGKNRGSNLLKSMWNIAKRYGIGLWYQHAKVRLLLFQFCSITFFYLMTSQTFFQAQFLLPAPYSIFHIETFHFNVKPQVVRLQRKSCFVTTRMRAVSRRY